MFRAVTKSIYARFHSLAGMFLRREKGQVLPIALAVLALGILVIGPFLSHAGTALKSSGQYKVMVNENYAGEAGVEQAIWALTNDALPGQLADVGSSLHYSLSQTVNSLSAAITVRWLSSSGPGIISNNNLDTLQFTASSYAPRIIPVSNSVYAIVYRDGSDRGVLCTFSIDSAGNISNSLLDSYTFNSSGCYEPDIVQVGTGLFVIAFRGSSNDGFVDTVAINSSGSIAHSLIDSLAFDSSICYRPRIIKISGDVYAIVYRGDSNDGFLKTITINSNGQILDTVIDTLEFDPKNCYEPYIFRVSGDIYGVAYRGQSNDGNLDTFSITTSGQISNSNIDSFLFDSGKGWEPSVVQAGATVFAIAFRDQSSDGCLKTISISSTGVITRSIIDSMDFDSSDGYKPVLIPVSGDVYAVSYRGSSNDGFVRTIAIESSGQISSSLIDTIDFETANAYEPQIIHISGDIYAVAYRKGSLVGYVKTINIATEDADSDNNNTYQVDSCAGGTTISAKISVMGGEPSVLSWNISP